MKIRNLLIAHSVVALSFGASFLGAPVQVMELYGAGAITATTVFVARLLGAKLLVLGMTAWLARNAGEGDPALRAYSMACVAGFSVAAVVAAHATLTGILNALGWSAVALYVGLGAGYAAFAFRKAGPSAAALKA